MAHPLPEGRIDTLGVFDALERVPSHIERALNVDIDVDGTSAPVAGILLVASGADAQVAAAAMALVAPFAPVPVMVHDGYGLPSFVSDEWRCIFISQSDSPEVHDALDRAGVDRAEVVVVGSSPVVDKAKSEGYPTVGVDFAVPRARLAFAGTLVVTLRLLERYGAISTPLSSGDVAVLAAAAVERIETRMPQLVGGGEALRLARRIGHTLPLIYSAGRLGAVAALRWKAQINDNAKVAAFASSLPEAMHHELSGWGQHGDMTRQVFSLIELRHDFEGLAGARWPLVEHYLDEVVAARHEIRADGAGPLAQLLDLTHIGDVVSFYLAQEHEVDPGPTIADTIATTD